MQHAFYPPSALDIIMEKLRNELTVVETLLIESQRDNEQKQASLERYKRYVKALELLIDDAIGPGWRTSHQLEVSPAATPVDRTQTPLRLLSPSKRHQTPGSRMPSQTIRLQAPLLEAEEEESKSESLDAAAAHEIPTLSTGRATPEREGTARAKEPTPASIIQDRRPPVGGAAELGDDHDSLVDVLSGAEGRLQTLVAQLSTLAAEARRETRRVALSSSSS